MSGGRKVRLGSDAIRRCDYGGMGHERKLPIHFAHAEELRNIEYKDAFHNGEMNFSDAGAKSCCKNNCLRRNGKGAVGIDRRTKRVPTRYSFAFQCLKVF